MDKRGWPYTKDFYSFFFNKIKHRDTRYTLLCSKQPSKLSRVTNNASDRAAFVGA